MLPRRLAQLTLLILGLMPLAAPLHADPLGHDDRTTSLYRDVLRVGEGGKPLLPLFGPPAEMIDVAESELLAERHALIALAALPAGQDAPRTVNHAGSIKATRSLQMRLTLDSWNSPCIRNEPR